MDSKECNELIAQTNQFDLSIPSINVLRNYWDPLLVDSKNGLLPASSAIVQNCSIGLVPTFDGPRAEGSLDGNSNFFSFANTPSSTEFLNLLVGSQPRSDFSLQGVNQEPDSAKLTLRERSMGVGQSSNEKYADILQASITTVQSSLRQFFDQPEYLEKLQTAFGANFDQAKITVLLESYQIPEIEIVPANILHGADGAFAISSNTIYLADSLLANNNPSHLHGVLLEEIGHHIDVIVNQNDAAGDEGAIFANLVNGVQLSSTDYLALIRENDHSEILWHGQSLAVEDSVSNKFAIRAVGTVEVKGNSDFDGEPLNLQDDSLIYAGQGFVLKGNTILPVQRDANGNPLRNAQGKLLLVDKAVAVAPGYFLAETNSKDYANLLPPQVVAKEVIDVPTYALLEKQNLTDRLPTTVPTVFDASLVNISTLSRWQQRFPANGTTTQPKIIRVINDDLNIPSGVSISNAVIIVENGDIDFQDSTQQLSNVTLVTKNGDIHLGNIQSNNLTVLSSGEIDTGAGARFGGVTLITSKNGDISFKGATNDLSIGENLTVVAHGEINFQSSTATRGNFLSTEDFVANGNTNIYGTIASQASIFLKGSTTVTYIPATLVDTIPPVITIKLTNDTGSSAIDRITNDIAISGTVTDASAISSFTGGFDSTATTSFVNLRPYLQTNGSFSLTNQQVRTVFGNLADGSHTLHLTAKDQFGNQSPVVDLALAIDTSSPAPTAITLITDSGVSAVDGITNINRPVFTGKAEAGASVQLFNGINVLGNGTADANGNWQITSSLLADGTYSLSAKATDKAGNISLASELIGITVDTQGPQLAFSSPVNLAILKNDGRLVGTLAEANFHSLSYRWDNNPVIALSLAASSFNQALDFTSISNGVHTLTVVGTDKAGNVSTSDFSVTVAIDNAAPEVLADLTQDTGIAGDRLTSNPSITARITDANQVTSVKAGLDTGSLVDVTARRQADGSLVLDRDFWVSIAPAGNLTEGGHTVHLVAEDRFGNRSRSVGFAESGIVDTTFTLDSLAPVLQLARDLNGAVLNNNSRLQGQATDSSSIASIRYQFDGAPAITLPSGTQFDMPFDFTGINDGAHQLLVTATDIAGNSVSRSYGVTVARGPLVTLALLNDTGSSNTDGITSDINVRGQVADRTRISRLEFSLDNNPNFSDLTVILQLDGTFRLSPTQMNSLAGGTLALGAHSLTVQGVLADGSLVDTATLNFTYQASSALVPSLTLAKSSDTGVLGDLVTSNGTADLVAKTQAGNTVQLGALTAVADANGIATFSGVALTLGNNDFALTTTNANGDQSTSTTRIIRTNPDDVILTWNHITLDAIRRENTPPPAAARVLAMVHTAMFDAVNAIEQKYSIYRVDATAALGADKIAAAAEAAYKVLASIYPNQQSILGTELTKSLQNGASETDRAAGVAVGDVVAANILAWRQQDGARNAVAYNPGQAAGTWQPDLPNYDGALLPQWGSVTTFGLSSGSQFRPAGAPALTSAEYTQDFAETKDYGARDSQVRSADQTQSALFWADGNGTYTPSGHWNDIAATAASVTGKSIIDNARVFAQLNVALADAGIAAWDTKYAYNTWRPITAIREADRDGNASTTADPNWLPLTNTPPFPEYVSGHSTFSSAAATVLGSAFGNNFSFTSGSVGLPDVSRSFSSFDGAAAEAGQSRIYGGIHFQFSNRDGLALGKKIGDYVVSRFMVDNSNSPIAVNLVQDTAAFGATNRDRITQNGAIAGEIRLTPAGLKLQVSVNGGQFVDVSDTVGVDRKFTLSAARLATIAGGALTDRSYQLALRLVEANGTVAGSNNFNFTLDRSAALVQVNTLGTNAVPQVHLTGTVTDPNGGSSGRLKVDGGAWQSFIVAADGSFDRAINPQGLTVGNHRVELEIADVAGNVTGQAIDFTVAANSDFFTSGGSNPGWVQTLPNGFALYEGNSLATQYSVNLVLGGTGKRTIDFDLKANFDKSDLLSVGRDRLAVYIVDANNQPMSLTADRPAALPLFSLSEGNAEIIPGLVRFDGNHVQLDVSGMRQTTAGKLVIQLLGQDTDSRSNVQVTNLVNILDPTGTPGTVVGSYTTPMNPGATADFTGYLSTNSAQLLLNNVSLDRATGKYLADLQVQNVGSTVLSRRLAVLLASLPAGVTVNNASGVHPAGSPYLNFETAIRPGGLAAGAISDAVRVEISDPSLVAFSFKPIVLQGPSDVIPSLASLANLTVKVGDKLDIPLQGTGDPVTLSIQSAGNLPTGQITGNSHLVFAPAPDQVGTYQFTLIARTGATEVRQAINLNVVADPITTTRVTGVIADTNQAGLANVLVELSGYQATTDANGKFVIELPQGAAGDTLKVYGQRIQGGGVTYPFIAEKMDLLLGHKIYSGVSNAIDRPIFLPLIDVSTGTTVNPGQNTVVTNPRLPGAKVTVPANSLFDKNGNAFNGILSITQVPADLTPAALPKNIRPDLVVTIQPGDMVFNTPARLTLPNLAGYAPGADMDLWSINPNTGVFDRVGLARVSADGTVIETIEGGIRNSSWHFLAPPVPPIDPPPPEKCDICEAAGDFNSSVAFDTGGVTETHDLVSYQSLGENRGLTLSYSSLRADARPILNFDFLSLKNTQITNGTDLFITAEVLVKNGTFSETTPKAFWKVPTALKGSTEPVTTSVQVDMRNKGSGVFEYQANTGFSIPFIVAPTERTSPIAGKITNINFINSNFGSGWGIAGVQEIVENTDGSVLLIDGGGSHFVFDQPQRPGGAYTSPPLDSSQLIKLADGTFQRTTTDHTVYKFDGKNRLVSVTDNLGRETRHIYNAAGQLVQVVDPTGLATVLSYGTNGKVASITDPANRVTAMVYDSQGNLVSITNPDGAVRQFSYDAGHHMTEEINQQGKKELSFYDPISGRATHSIRADGSEIHLIAKQTLGLYAPELTRSPGTAPSLNGIESVTTYIDSNGNVSYVELDDTGHGISTVDGVGRSETVERDAQGRIILQTDSLGNRTRYAYDERSNVIRKLEETLAPTTVSNTGNITSNFGLSFGNPYDVSMEVADINNDGWQDAIVLSKSYTSSENKLSIWLGNSDSKFVAGSSYELGTTNTNFKLGDLNQDGKVDILVGKNNEAIVYLGNGQGGFSQYASYDLNNGQLNSISLADINGDRFEDLAYRGSSGFYVRLGRGTGEFGAAYQTSVDWQDFTGGGFLNSARLASAPTTVSEISTGDLDGDGKVDWLVPTSHGFRIVLNKGLGDYRPQNEVNTSIQVSSSAAAVIDADKDGDLDVLSWVPGQRNMKLYLNSGTGNFTYNSTIDVGFGIESLVVTDFDNNQTQDIVVKGSLNSHGILLGSGNATFQTIQLLSNLPLSVRSIAVGDFDGYGSNDVLAVTTRGITLVPGGSLPVAQSVRSVSVTSYTYDPIWNKLTSVVDPLGRKTLYQIDAATGYQLAMTQVVGLLDSTSGETNDVTTRYSYTAQGLVDTETDALGRVKDYDYDLRGNLIRSTQAKGTAEEAVTTYEYDLAGNQIAMVDPLGRRTQYVYNTANMLVRTIQPDPDGVGPQTAPVTEYQYDKMGNRVLERDARGNETRYEYDAMGRTTKMIEADPDGVGAQVSAVTTYEYDLAGNQIAVVDPLGRRTTSVYDVRNRLVVKIDANGGRQQMIYDTENRLVGAIDANGHRHSMNYDAQGRLMREVDALNQFVTTEYDAAGQVTETKDQLGRVNRYQYDDLGRQIVVTNALGQVTRTEYDKVGNVTATIDANGNRTEYKYDVLNRQIEMKDALGGVSRSVYDRAGRIVSSSDALNRTTTFNYDALDRLTRITDALGYSITSSYDAVGNLLGVTDASGNTTSYTYDNLNRRVSTINALGNAQTIIYDAVGNLLSMTNELGQTTSYAYDVMNQLIRVTDALGHSTTSTYDLMGNVLSTTDAINRTTTFTYDALNRRNSTTNPLGQKISVTYDSVGNVIKTTDALGRETLYSYDNLNRQTTIANALGNTTSQTFDAVGNRLSVADALGRMTTYTYDALNRQIATTNALNQSQSVVYNAVGNVVRTTDERGQFTTYVYDAMDRVTQVTNPLGNTFMTTYDREGNVQSVKDGLGQTTTYTYDALNRRVKVTDAKGGNTSTRYDKLGNVVEIKDANGNATTYSYDAVNRMVLDTNQLGFSRYYLYDAVGNRIQAIDRNGRKVRYSYDDLDRQTSENWLDVNDHSIHTQTYSYDAVGNLTSATAPNSQYSYTYDAINRVTSRSNAGTSGVATVVFSYLYDAVDRLVTVRDRINGIAAAETNYFYDHLNRTTKITQTGSGVQTKRVEMTYNEVDQVTNLSRFSDLSTLIAVTATSYSYDQNQRLTQLAHRRGAINLATYAYTYDSADKLTQLISSIDGTTNYAYDVTNQLTGADHSSQTDEAYSYDANGNRTNAGYQTGNNNQMLADGTYTYEYDKEGNRTNRTEVATGNVTEYAWDYHNRLVGVVFKDAAGAVIKSVEYLYDINNLRIGKKIDGVVTERYVLDRDHIAIVFDGQGNQTQRYFYGTGVDQVLAEEVGSQMHWLLGDHQGTIRDVVDGNGSVIDHVTYDSFGQILTQTSNIDLRFAYTGREWDQETGQYYYRARYYDAAVGRFISEDPIGFSGGDSNLSRYTYNSPLNSTDPSGLLSMSSLAKEVGSYFHWLYPVLLNKGNYYHTYDVASDGRLIKNDGWRNALPRIFRGPRQHVQKFMDHYFEGYGAPFDLNSEGLIDSIEGINVFKQATKKFWQSSINKARREIENLMLYEKCPSVPVFKTLNFAQKIPLDATSENFAIGRTALTNKAVIYIEGSNGKFSFHGFTTHEIYDKFNDVNDFKSQTPEPDELPGGVGYVIQGKWVKNIP